ncbi:MAG: pantetheine-phosphate adenylyltransferase [Candidatus Eremiobacteraeota bacterium]|nr:pantetheine-phosphate adenylyltransferase [Candidatus Eremiobacteraeota bacterium]
MGYAVYPGSFDPITMGHLNIIERSSAVFEKVIVAVLINPQKTPLFTLEERVAMISKSVEGIPRVEVETFSGLLVKFLEKKNASIIVKGLRAISDFEFEFSMALMNRRLNPGIETMFLMTEDRYAFLSSSKIKEIYALGGTAKGFVPECVEPYLMTKYAMPGLMPGGQEIEKD